MMERTVTAKMILSWPRRDSCSGPNQIRPLSYIVCAPDHGLEMTFVAKPCWMWA